MQHTVGTIASGRTRVSGLTREPRCRLCRAAVARTFVDFGVSPRSNVLLTADQLDQMEAHYPLRVLVCDKCFLVQLQDCVAPDRLLMEQASYSSYSQARVARARAYCQMIQPRLGLRPRDLVLEVGSNDGYLLQHFLPMGIPVVGIDPAANVADAARRRGVTTLVESFATPLAERLVMEGRRASLIIANNVLDEVPTLGDFMDATKLLLAPEGVVTMEVPHLPRLMADMRIEAFSHQRFSYFSLVTLDHLAESHGLKVIDAEKLDVAGGTLRVYLAHAASSRRTAPRVSELLEEEIDEGYLTLDTYTMFGEQARCAKRALLSFLLSARQQGKRICGYGATPASSMLLNTCGIGADLVDFIADQNPYRHGRFTPGTRIPVKPLEFLDEARPDLILVLPWQMSDEIVRRISHVTRWGGRLVTPLPELRVLTPLHGSAIASAPATAHIG
ncbi:MAG TPA: class I SAM-dependent methyltransferase [Hyphomicrobiaceae bacterium]|nr:class I SAM-dependent methyltransferase [Hyphomicrobiaceae bacterium]